VHVRGISVYQIDSKEEAFKLIKKSMKNKAIRSTDYNNVSSRSHTVFQLLIFTEETNPDGIKLVKRSTLSLIDLAGSEKWRPTLSMTSQNSAINNEIDMQVKEMTNINTSLHVLGNCIAKLIDSDSKHIPYRDSILTRLLQNTLNGNGKSIIIATIHLDDDYMEENYSTLQFASRASKVKVTLQPNVGINTSSGEQLSLLDAQKQIKYLQQQLYELKHQPQITPGGEDPQLQHLQQQLQQMQPIQFPPQQLECFSCQENTQKLANLELHLREIEKENHKLKEKLKKLKEQLKQQQQQSAIPLQQQPQQQQQTVQNPAMQHGFQSQVPPGFPVSPSPVNDSGMMIGNSNVMRSSVPYPQYSQQQPQSQQIMQQSSNGIAYYSSNPSVTNNTSNFSSFSHEQQQQQQRMTSSSQVITNAPAAVITSFNPSKLKTGEKCRKHSLEDCVLCSMFGNSSSDGGPEISVPQQTAVSTTNTNYSIGPENELKPKSSSRRNITTPSLLPSTLNQFETPISHSSSFHLSRGFTPKTPLSDMKFGNVSNIRDENEDNEEGGEEEEDDDDYLEERTSSHKNNSNDLDSSLNICKAHSLRNCLLCANEFTFQKEIQLTNSMEKLKKQTSALVGNPKLFNTSSPSPGGMNQFNSDINTNAFIQPHKLSPLHSNNMNNNNPQEVFSRGTPSLLIPTNAEMSMNSGMANYISTLDSLEKSKNDYGFASTSQSLHQSQGSSYRSQPIPAPTPQPILITNNNYDKNSLKNVSPNDAALAALAAANSLLSSGDFGDVGFSSSQVPSSNQQQQPPIKSKRLRELKALTTHSIGNATSPGVIESNPNHQFLQAAASSNPRRTSTSPSPNLNSMMSQSQTAVADPIFLNNNYSNDNQNLPPMKIQLNNSSSNAMPNSNYNSSYGISSHQNYPISNNNNNNNFSSHDELSDEDADDNNDENENGGDFGDDEEDDLQHYNHAISASLTQQQTNTAAAHGSTAAVKVKQRPSSSSRKIIDSSNYLASSTQKPTSAADVMKKKKLKKKKKKVLDPKPVK
jgi:hypothetical protein